MKYAVRLGNGKLIGICESSRALYEYVSSYDLMLENGYKIVIEQADGMDEYLKFCDDNKVSAFSKDTLNCYLATDLTEYRKGIRAKIKQMQKEKQNEIQHK